MSETFRCDDKETLVAYLYGDIDGDGRREVERHLRTCAACTREVDGLQSVRQDLALWLPPDADLGFAVVQKPAAVLRPSRWAALGAMPAWAQVAAAALFIAAGAAIANVQIRSTAEGITVSTGWIQPAAPPAAPAAVASNEEWRRELVALEQNLRREFAVRTATPAPIAVSSRSADATDTAAVLRRVEAMLTASEQRQREELALRLSMADRDWNVRHQTDLMKINNIFGRLQRGAIRTEQGQQEVFNLLRRASSPNP